jgi:photosystem II stability/assembly factor-like uncharacterized protein
MTAKPRFAGRARAALAAATLSMLLAACGGGSDSPPPPPTELPTVLQVTGPVDNNALGAPVSFSTNVVTQSSGVRYDWQFGDGGSSTLATPSHDYARAGVYTVQLTVTNEVGASRTTSAIVYVADTEVVRGKQCSGTQNTGWCWQRPLPQGNTLSHYFYASDTHGWAVGELGTVMATIDGGVTWQRQYSGTEMSLSKAVFVDTQVGWVVGTSGQLLKTNNGGATWTAVSYGQSEMPASIGASDANNAWVVNPWSSGVWVTRDGGSRWSRVQAENQGVQTYVPINGNEMWAMSWSNLLRTTDGGTTWTSMPLPASEAGLYRSFSSLYAVDMSHAWLKGYESGYVNGTYVSRAVALKTSDGGNSWQAFSTDSNIAYYTKFFDANTGFAWGYYGNAAMRTNDGGASWQTLTLPQTSSSYYSEFQALSAQQLVIKDSAGRAYRSSDSGATWVERTAGGATAPWLTSVWFFDSREGMATGVDGSASRTMDGGQTWTTTPAQSRIGWRRLQFRPSGTGWLISDNGGIYRSTDKGRSWFAPAPQSAPSTPSVSDFHFISDQEGWAVTPYAWSAQASVFHTVDGGASWQPMAGSAALSGFVGVRFADATHGIAVGPAGYAAVTTDGGVTWDPRATGVSSMLRRVVFIDANTALAVGEYGTIVRSTDRGQTWSRVRSGTNSSLNDVSFVSANVGWAVGEQGVVLVTRDGGQTWAVQTSGASASFSAAFFVDEQTGWLVGTNGSILATATGGR